MEIALIFFAFICLLFFILYTFKKLGNGWSMKLLLKDFNRKMWMTAGLGIFFFSLYALAVVVGAPIIRQWGASFFFLVYQNPLLFIYGGMGLFALLSVSIYLARLAIKYFYLTYGKD
jgi:hypothetical protein